MFLRVLLVVFVTCIALRSGAGVHRCHAVALQPRTTTTTTMEKNKLGWQQSPGSGISHEPSFGWLADRSGSAAESLPNFDKQPPVFSGRVYVSSLMRVCFSRHTLLSPAQRTWFWHFSKAPPSSWSSPTPLPPPPPIFICCLKVFYGVAIFSRDLINPLKGLNDTTFVSFKYLNGLCILQEKLSVAKHFGS